MVTQYVANIDNFYKQICLLIYLLICMVQFLWSLISQFLLSLLEGHFIRIWSAGASLPFVNSQFSARSRNLLEGKWIERFALLLFSLLETITLKSNVLLRWKMFVEFFLLQCWSRRQCLRVLWKPFGQLVHLDVVREPSFAFYLWCPLLLRRNKTGLAILFNVHQSKSAPRSLHQTVE